MRNLSIYSSFLVCGADSRRVVHRDLQSKLSMRRGSSRDKGVRVLSRRLWPSVPVRSKVPQGSWPEVCEGTLVEWYVLSREREEVREDGRLLQGDAKERGKEDSPEG